MRKILAVIALLAASALFISFSAVGEDYSALRCVMETHPDWPAPTDEEMVIWLNTESVSYRPTNAPSRDIWDVIIRLEDYDVLSDADRDLVRTTLFGGGNNDVDISSTSPATPTVAMLVRVFTGTPTLPALNNAFTYLQSPCESISWPADCHLGDVQNAQNATCVP